MAAPEKKLIEQTAESDLDENAIEPESIAVQSGSTIAQAVTAQGDGNEQPAAPANMATGPRPVASAFGGTPYQAVGLQAGSAPNASTPINRDFQMFEPSSAGRKYVAYTIKLPSEQLAALQSIWLELKRLYGAHSPDKSGMIQQAIADWLRRWDGPERQQLLQDLLDIRQDTRRRQYRK